MCISPIESTYKVLQPIVIIAPLEYASEHYGIAFM